MGIVLEFSASTILEYIHTYIILLEISCMMYVISITTVVTIK